MMLGEMNRDVCAALSDLNIKPDFQFEEFVWNKFQAALLFFVWVRR